MRKLSCVVSCLIGTALAARSLSAQQAPDLKEVIDRLDRLEAQNRELMDEIRTLRLQLAAAQPSTAALAEGAPPSADAVALPRPAAERLDVAEQRIADLDQSKVSSDHRLP